MDFSGCYIFKQVSYDTAVFPVETLVRPGVSAQLFNQPGTPGLPGAPDRSSVADIDEPALVRWLLGATATRELLLEALGLPVGATAHVEVGRIVFTSAPGLPGDVDLVCFDRDLTLAVAAEAKRVTVKVETDTRGESLVRIGKVGHGKAQAKGLVKLEFHRCWIVLILAMDAAEGAWLNSPNVGPAGRSLRKIRGKFVLDEDLDDPVGIMLVSVVQPSLKPLELMANVGVCVLRQPHPQPQPSDLSERIDRYHANTAPVTISRH